MEQTRNKPNEVLNPNADESKCLGTKEWIPGVGFEYDCGYNTTLDCDDCKYGGGRKDPAAKCNQIKEL